MESWGRFPKERKRLFQLIQDTKKNGVIFISGDVHFGEITRYDCAVGYPLYDVTSSGLVQSVEKVFPRPLRFIVRLLFWYTPNTMRVTNDNCRYKSCTYGIYSPLMIVFFPRKLWMLRVLHLFWLIVLSLVLMNLNKCSVLIDLVFSVL